MREHKHPLPVISPEVWLAGGSWQSSAAQQSMMGVTVRRRWDVIGTDGCVFTLKV